MLLTVHLSSTGIRSSHAQVLLVFDGVIGSCRTKVFKAASCLSAMCRMTYREACRKWRGYLNGSLGLYMSWQRTVVSILLPRGT